MYIANLLNHINAIIYDKEIHIWIKKGGLEKSRYIFKLTHLFLGISTDIYFYKITVFISTCNKFPIILQVMSSSQS